MKYGLLGLKAGPRGLCDNEFIKGTIDESLPSRFRVPHLAKHPGPTQQDEQEGVMTTFPPSGSKQERRRGNPVANASRLLARSREGAQG
eukprot:6001318-Alexandrium_andersonii.AAC.1